MDETPCRSMRPNEELCTNGSRTTVHAPIEASGLVLIWAFLTQAVSSVTPMTCNLPRREHKCYPASSSRLVLRLTGNTIVLCYVCDTPHSKTPAFRHIVRLTPMRPSMAFFRYIAHSI